jgi:hypothetical protein
MASQSAAQPAWWNTNGSVLIASSIASDSSNKEVVAREKADASAAGNLVGTVADINGMYKFHHVTGRKVTAMFVTVKDSSVEKVMAEFHSLFNSGLHSCLLYYSGHGRADKGDWCFQNAAGTYEFISLQMILHAWDQRGIAFPEQQLVIIADCCFSGVWVAELNRLMLSDVRMQAACGATEKCVDTLDGGLFTTVWLDVQNQFVKQWKKSRAAGWQPLLHHSFWFLHNSSFRPTCYPMWTAASVLGVHPFCLIRQDQHPFCLIHSEADLEALPVRRLLWHVPHGNAYHKLLCMSDWPISHPMLMYKEKERLARAKIETEKKFQEAVALLKLDPPPPASGPCTNAWLCAQLRLK